MADQSMLAPSMSIADSVTATRTRIGAGRTRQGRGLASALGKAGGRRPVAAEKQGDGDQPHGNDQRQVQLRRHAEMRDAGAEKARAEEADAPEGMRAVHDAPPQHVFGPVGLDIEDDLDAADHQADGDQQEESASGPGACTATA